MRKTKNNKNKKGRENKKIFPYFHCSLYLEGKCLVRGPLSDFAV